MCYLDSAKRGEDGAEAIERALDFAAGFASTVCGMEGSWGHGHQSSNSLKSVRRSEALDSRCKQYAKREKGARHGWVPFDHWKTMGIKACAAGFCCADVYQNIGVFYPTGNGIDWGIHLARMGVSVSAVSVVGKDEYGDKMREALAAEVRYLTSAGGGWRHLGDAHGIERRRRSRASRGNRWRNGDISTE